MAIANHRMKQVSKSLASSYPHVQTGQLAYSLAGLPEFLTCWDSESLRKTRALSQP